MASIDALVTALACASPHRKCRDCVAGRTNRDVERADRKHHGTSAPLVRRAGAFDYATACVVGMYDSVGGADVNTRDRDCSPSLRMIYDPWRLNSS
jgi:hypothetical protein